MGAGRLFVFFLLAVCLASQAAAVAEDAATGLLADVDTAVQSVAAAIPSVPEVSAPAVPSVEVPQVASDAVPEITKDVFKAPEELSSLESHVRAAASSVSAATTTAASELSKTASAVLHEDDATDEADDDDSDGAAADELVKKAKAVATGAFDALVLAAEKIGAVLPSVETASLTPDAMRKLKHQIRENDLWSLTFGNRIFSPMLGGTKSASVDYNPDHFFIVRGPLPAKFASSFADLEVVTANSYNLVHTSEGTTASEVIASLPEEIKDQSIPMVAGDSEVFAPFVGAPMLKASLISGITDQIDHDMYHRVHAGLIDVSNTRCSTNLEASTKVRSYITERFTSFGLEIVESVSYTVCGDKGAPNCQSQNVLGVLRGTSDEWILIGGHYDSIPCAANTPAPGAEDDGSGTAAVLLAAEAITASGYKPARTIYFAAFGGEEQGLLGSWAFVNDILANKQEMVESFRGAYLMDMITYSPKKQVLIETGKSAEAAFMAAELAQSALDYTCLKPFISTVYADSDHEPFLKKSMVAALLITGEWASYDCYHKSCDVIEKTDPLVGANIAKMVIASAVKRSQSLSPIK